MTLNKNYFATISEGVDEDGFWRVFYYAPGMGFETGKAVYVGRTQHVDRAQALEAKRQYDGTRRELT